MSDLNSVLFEGTLPNDPEFSYDQRGVRHCLLTIASERHFKEDNGIAKQTTTLHVHTEGKMAEQCATLCRRGRKIRVVGRLLTLTVKNGEGREAAELVIDAEHVEVKPSVSVRREQEPSRDGFSR
jgi:single-strand DNA-binding protein